MTISSDVTNGKRLSIIAAGIFVLFTFTVFCPMTYAWGEGHDVIGKAVAERLPESWKSKLTGSTLKQFLADNHYPDSMQLLEVERWGASDIEWLRQRGVRIRYDFHRAVNRALAFELLVKAIREKNEERTFLLLAILSHSMADQISCNHDPLVHLVTYGWCPRGLNLCKSLPIDAGWLQQNDWRMKIFQKMLDTIDWTDSPATPNDVFCQLINAEWEGTSGFSEGVRIVESAARFSSHPEDRTAGETLAKSLSILAAWGVEHTVKTFNAAVRFSQSGEKVVYDKTTITPQCREFANEFVANRLMSADPWAVPFLPKKDVLPRVGILYDPTGKFGDGFFSFLDRILSCMITGSLQKKYDAALFDIRRFNKEGIDASSTKLLVVCANICHPWMNLSPKDFHTKLKRYQESGGRILWIGMTPPRELAPGIVSQLQFGKNRQGYCKPAYPVSMEELMKSRVILAGEQVKSWPFVRKPVGSAGWFWYGGSAYMMKPLAKDIQPLLELQSSDATRVVGFAWPISVPQFVFLPNYAVCPYVLTKEIPQMSPLKLQLDSAGETIIYNCVNVLVPEN